MYVTQILHRGLRHNPDRPATVFGERIRTVAESVDRIARLAGALSDLGAVAGDRIAILALNSDRYHEYLLAVPWLGAVVNPVNIRWSAAEIAYSLRESGTRILLVDDAFAAVVPTLREQLPELGPVLFCGDGERPADLLDYETLVAGTSPIEDTRTGGDALLGVFYTGGTTGHPKGVMLSHDNLMTSALGVLADGAGPSAGGQLLHAAPMFHLADIANWCMGNLVGATHVMVPAFTPAGVLEAIATHRVTDTLLVPTMVQMLIDESSVGDYDLGGVRHVLYGASPIAESVLERARATFPNAGFTQAYGMTELAPVATLLSAADHQDSALRRAAGRAAPHCEVRVVDPDDNEVPAGTVGEVVVRGDNVMLGYWNRPEDTAVALRGGWMHTGDGGYMDSRGYVFIVDRIKDMIITGGENVYSAEVENALIAHPSVAAAAVIGVPDPQWGERVHAVVVPHPGETVTEAELRAHCKALIAGYKVPRSAEFVAALPMSGAGKVLKRELREPHWNHSDHGVA
ncbi:long-chain fatty acid--CoA ligase [Nocardia sp. NPDC050712]|uniref:acyl-CoA synthetase n=1 Tax=Nocardia sp. NPDC050712 TaxID=3155518 RepID=UPI0033F8E7DE